MTYQPPGRQGPASVEVARVRGGISPRVGAVAVAGVLAAVVWIGISGRPAPTAPASEKPGIAQAATASPSTTAEETVTPLPVGSPSPPPVGPPPAVTPRPGAALLVGNDGIFGWPVVGQLQRQSIPRGRGLYNKCRWDVSPMSGIPRSGDEAGC